LKNAKGEHGRSEEICFEGENEGERGGGRLKFKGVFLEKKNIKKSKGPRTPKPMLWIRAAPANPSLSKKRGKKGTGRKRMNKKEKGGFGDGVSTGVSIGGTDLLA